MPASPSTANYFVGKGILSFNRLDADGLPVGVRDLGNAPAFSIGPTVEKLDHFSSRAGVKQKDLTVILSQGLNVKFTLDEITLENLALAFYGEVSGNVLTLLASSQVQGALKLVGTNSVGEKVQVDLWKISINATGDTPFIGDSWGQIEFEGEVISDADNHASSPYGTITALAAGS
jgi:hypothetical protein